MQKPSVYNVNKNWDVEKTISFITSYVEKLNLNNSYDVEDMVSDIYLRILESKMDTGYVDIRRIVWSIENLNRKKITPIPLGDQDNTIYELSPIDDIANNIVVDEIIKSELTLRYQDVFTKICYDKMTYLAVANIYGVSYARIQQIYHIACRKLRKRAYLLDKEYSHPTKYATINSDKATKKKLQYLKQLVKSL